MGRILKNRRGDILPGCAAGEAEADDERHRAQAPQHHHPRRSVGQDEGRGEEADAEDERVRDVIRRP